MHLSLTWRAEAFVRELFQMRRSPMPENNVMHIVFLSKCQQEASAKCSKNKRLVSQCAKQVVRAARVWFASHKWSRRESWWRRFPNTPDRCRRPNCSSSFAGLRMRRRRRAKIATKTAIRATYYCCYCGCWINSLGVEYNCIRSSQRPLGPSSFITRPRRSRSHIQRNNQRVESNVLRAMTPAHVEFLHEGLERLDCATLLERPQWIAVRFSFRSINFRWKLVSLYRKCKTAITSSGTQRCVSKGESTYATCSKCPKMEPFVELFRDIEGKKKQQRRAFQAIGNLQGIYSNITQKGFLEKCQIATHLMSNFGTKTWNLCRNSFESVFWNKLQIKCTFSHPNTVILL